MSRSAVCMPAAPIGPSCPRRCSLSKKDDFPDSLSCGPEASQIPCVMLRCHSISHAGAILAATGRDSRCNPHCSFLTCRAAWLCMTLCMGRHMSMQLPDSPAADWQNGCVSVGYSLAAGAFKRSLGALGLVNAQCFSRRVSPVGMPRWPDHARPLHEFNCKSL